MAGPSDAVKMAECLADLINGRNPRWPRSVWLPFVQTQLGAPEPSSPNREEGANACEALWQWKANNLALVRQILDYENQRHVARPFMWNEAMTKEPVYRVLHAYTPGIFVALAESLNPQHPARLSCARTAQSHVAWLALGIAMRPHRRIVNHENGAKNGCVLIGTAKPKTGLRYVAQAGQRSFIRHGKNANGDVEFVDSITCQVILAQVMGWQYPKKAERVQADLYDGFTWRFPGLHPFALYGLGFGSIVAFVNDPTAADKASVVTSLLRVPEQPYRIDRFSDGSVVTMLEGERNSSTDEVMIDAAYENGEIRWATCSDGVRSTQEDQIAWEEGDSYACQKAGGGPTFRIAKPRGTSERWQVTADGKGRISFSAPGWTNPQSPPPPTPPGTEPDQPDPKPRRRLFNFS